MGRPRSQPLHVRVGERFGQLRLATPVVAAPRRRPASSCATRRRSAVAVFSTPGPPRAPDLTRLDCWRPTIQPRSFERSSTSPFAPPTSARARALASPAQLADGLRAVMEANGWHFSSEWLDQARREARTRLTLRAGGCAARSRPSRGRPACERGVGRGNTAALRGNLRAARRQGLSPGRSGRPRRETGRSPTATVARLEGSRPRAGEVGDADLARFLEAEGRLVRVGDRLALGIGAYDEAKRTLIEECESAGKITLARFRDLIRAYRAARLSSCLSASTPRRPHSPSRRRARRPASSRCEETPLNPLPCRSRRPG